MWLITHVVSHPLNMNVQPSNGVRPLNFGQFTYFVFISSKGSEWVWVCIIIFFSCVGFFWDSSAAQDSMRRHKRDFIIMSGLIYIVKYWGVCECVCVCVWGGGHRAETTHQNRPKRPNIKTGQIDPAKMTHGRNNSCSKLPKAKTNQNHDIVDSGQYAA